jgi:hypothetical protein
MFRMGILFPHNPRFSKKIRKQAVTGYRGLGCRL